MVVMVMIVMMVMVVIKMMMNRGRASTESWFHGFRTSGSRQRNTSSTTATTARVAHPPPPQTLRITRSELWFVMLVYDLSMHPLQSLICDHGLVDWHKIFPVGTRSIQDQEGWELHWIFQGWHIPLILFFLTEDKIFVTGWKGQVLHKSGGGTALRLRVQGSPTARGQTGESIKLIWQKSGNLPSTP